MTRKSRNAQTEHSRRLRMETANARIERLKSEGWERKFVLLPPESLDIIEHKKAEYGGISGVIIAALKKMTGEKNMNANAKKKKLEKEIRSAVGSVTRADFPGFGGSCSVSLYRDSNGLMRVETHENTPPAMLRGLHFMGVRFDNMWDDNQGLNVYKKALREEIPELVEIIFEAEEEEEEEAE